jgi:hypothetical protein
VSTTGNRFGRAARVTGHIFEPWQINIEYLTIQKQERLQCLVLSRGTDFRVDGKVTQEFFHALMPQPTRMLPIMEVNVAPNPMQIDLFRTIGKMPGAHFLLRHLQQTPTLVHV